MAVLLSEGWESGTTDGWTDLGSVAPTVVSDPVYNGTKSLRCLTSAQTVKMKKSFTAGSQFGVRFAVRRSSASDEAGIVFALGDTAEDAYAFCIQNVSSQLLLRTFEAATFTTLDSGPAFTEGSWYLIEVTSDTSANPWEVAWRVDGLDLGEFTHAVAAENDIDSAYVGSFGFSMSWEVHHDYLTVTDTAQFISDVQPGDNPPIGFHGRGAGW